MKRKDRKILEDIVWLSIVIFAIVTKSIYAAIVVTFSLLLFYFIFKKVKKYNFYKKQESMSKIDMMTGIEFEEFLLINILQKMGYSKLRTTATTNDYGVDIIGYKDEIKCAIQCKRYNSKVSNKAIQEIVAGKNHYRCEKAIVITNNYYTSNAKELAYDNKVQLLDRDDIIRVINRKN